MKVLAICLDGAAPALIRRLIDSGDMPVLRSLEAQGGWFRVEAPADIGSGAVWPTFASGEPPSAHGIHGEWCWQPDTMSVKLFAGGQFVPFWKKFADAGLSVGVLDPPFVAPLRLNKGFEVIDWGAHDLFGAAACAYPQPIADFVLNKCERHPWSSHRYDNASADNPREMESLSRSCLRGAELRGRLAQQLLTKTQTDFALIVFPEIHHGSHHLWHTVGFDPVVHSGFDSEVGTAITPSLEDVCREIDRQIGNLTETVGSDCLVMVFSLHGMQPCAGVSSFLPELLCEKGFASLSEWSKQSWRDRARSLLARVKRRAPRIARELYYRTLSLDATRSLAAPTMLPVYDWSNTRAFSLPTDQHGWIRINLNGRERDGIVLLEEYDQTCVQLESLMSNLCREDGTPLVEEVVRTAPAATARSSKLPDLVVHWADSAFQSGQKISDSEVVTETISRKFTGQHARDGFCVIKGGYDIAKSDTICATDMHRIIEHWLRC